MSVNSASLFAPIEARKPKLAVVAIGIRRRGVGRDNGARRRTYSPERHTDANTARGLLLFTATLSDSGTPEVMLEVA
jgi:hypothetical protein